MASTDILASADFLGCCVEKNYEDFYEFSKKECFGRLVMPSTDREDAISGEHAHNIFVIPELSFHFLKLENGSTK